MILLWVALGGALGVAARHGARALAGGASPGARLRLLAAEAAGALLTGVLLHLWLAYRIAPQGFGLPFAIGVLGGYVTSTAFNDDTHRSFQEGPWSEALLNLLLSAIVSLGAGLTGILGARRVLGPSLLLLLLPAAALAGVGAASGDPHEAPAVHPPLVSTFSIVALDPGTGELGVAVQSRWFSVGSLVPWAEHGVGAVATQSFIEPGYGPQGLALLREGKSPEEALRQLTAADPQRDFRQVGIVDARGRASAWTGKECISHAGHKTASNYSVQGNLLASADVWPAMGRAFEAANGRLADRLLAALEAGQKAGGDARGMQSAALLVVGPGEPGKPWTERKIDLRVEDHPEPIPELRRLVRLHRAYGLANEGDRLVSEKKFAAAFKAYDEALALDPQNDELMFWRASMYMQAGRVDEAVADVRRALALNPRWRALLERLPPSAFTGAGEILERLER